MQSDVQSNVQSVLKSERSQAAFPNSKSDIDMSQNTFLSPLFVPLDIDALIQCDLAHIQRIVCTCVSQKSKVQNTHVNCIHTQLTIYCDTHIVDVVVGSGVVDDKVGAEASTTYVCIYRHIDNSFILRIGPVSALSLSLTSIIYCPCESPARVTFLASSLLLTIFGMS